MKFGVREICDVVFRAKSARKIGSRQFYKNEPVLYFDSLKTSTLEGAVTTVYATGGRGNSRLVAWDGERTLTFTMEDALISDIGIAILASADLISATTDKPINVHAFSTHAKEDMALTEKSITLEGVYAWDGKDDNGNTEIAAYLMFMKNGEVFTEPYICDVTAVAATEGKKATSTFAVDSVKGKDFATDYEKADQIMLDYYVTKSTKVTQINITPETFGGNFYIEASTLFRDQVSGVDMPAEFIIPNGKVQSNFTFTMASSGDPSTFTFTVDAMPDYTRFDKTKKVLAAIQVIEDDIAAEASRESTDADHTIKA